MLTLRFYWKLMQRMVFFVKRGKVMKSLAAIQERSFAPLKLTEIELEAPREHEVLVRVIACGVCHTDLMVKDHAASYPYLLGHEGSGVVVSVGEQVAEFSPGDHVIASYTSCGECASCLAGKPYACRYIYDPYFFGFREDGTSPVSVNGYHVGALIRQGAFSQYMVVNERALTKVDEDLDIRILAPLGCGVMTGAGSVWNYLQPNIGESILVLGFGGVGFGAVCAARNLGIKRIAVIDKNNVRLKTALDCGATDAISASELNQFIKDNPTRFDYLFDSTGSGELLRKVEATLTDAAKGCGSAGGSLRSHPFESIDEGHSIPQEMIPEMIRWYRRGTLPMREIVRLYPFELVNQAIAAMERGEVIKPILTM